MYHCPHHPPGTHSLSDFLNDVFRSDRSDREMGDRTYSSPPTEHTAAG